MKALAVATRNGFIESIHYGYICVLDEHENVIYSVGDYNDKIFFRSSAKPIQAIPVLESGAADYYKLSLNEVALICSSHSGQKMHQDTAINILKKINLNINNLRCGTMIPYNTDENKDIIRQGNEPNSLHCSCSGKHCGMLALAKYKNYSLEDYEILSHPVQQEILQCIAEFAQEDINSIETGIDGCGVPVYLLSVYKIALSYLNLIKYAQDNSSKYFNSCKTIIDSMINYPEMVSGDNEFCTELMKSTNKNIVGKVGAEAVYCLGVNDKKISICVKIIDGNERAVYPVIIELLKKFNILNQEELKKLQKWHNPKIENNLKNIVGEILPVFDVEESIVVGKFIVENYTKQ